MVGLVEDAACRQCEGGKEESSEHLWMQCSDLKAQSFRYGLDRSLGELFENLVEALAIFNILLSHLR
jgi:hypothetical protein